MSERRQGLYKDAANRTADGARSKRRDKGVAIRKDERERILSMKRFNTAGMDEDESDRLMADWDVADEKIEEKMAELIESLGGADRVAGLTQLGQLFAEGSKYIDVFLKHERGMGCLINCLDAPESELAACSCITNIAASISPHTQTCVPAIPYLITLLASSNPYVQGQAAWALGNIAADGPALRDDVIVRGAPQSLMHLLASHEVAVLQQAAFAISMLLRGQGAPIGMFVAEGIVPMLMQVLTSHKDSSVDLVAEVAWSLTYLTAGHPEVLAALAEGGAIPTLLQHFIALIQADVDANSHAINPLLRMFGNFICGPDENLDIVMQSEGFDACLVTCINSSLRNLKLEALWVLSNITISPKYGAHFISLLLPSLLDVLSTGTFDMQREAMYSILNSGSQGGEAIDFLITHDVIPRVLSLFKSPDVDLMMACLQFIELVCRLHPEGLAIMNDCDVCDILDAQQYHDNPNIARMCSDLLERYFNVGEEQPLEDEEREEAPLPPWRMQ